MAQVPWRSHLVLVVDEGAQVAVQLEKAHALRSRHSKVVQRGIDDERLESGVSLGEAACGAWAGGYVALREHGVYAGQSLVAQTRG
jgi:hypothetical protein